ncbi:MAG: right-handed parallel beta-helix repeat-containing protein, partial [Phycisphaerae bacterium]
GSGTDQTAILDGFTISIGNDPRDWPDGCGGGMYNYGGSPMLTNCVFSGNTAKWGAGMYNDDNSSPTVTDCTFSGNWAEIGGGMWNSYSNPTVTKCTFTGNTGEYGGGGMENSGLANTTVTNCTFSGNSAVRGGGMENSFESHPTVTNCTFSGNQGGGMSNDMSHPTVTNCTFSGNQGVGLQSKVSSNPTIINCILWNNTGGSFSLSAGGAVTVSYSDVQGGWPGTGNIGADPLFADADGPDNIPGTEDDNLCLSPGSPCIDAGDNDAVPPDTTDLDGNPRLVDDSCTPDSGDAGAIGPPIVDMGSYEYQGDCNENGIPDACDVDCNSQECIDTGWTGDCGGSIDCNGNCTPDECESLEQYVENLNTGIRYCTIQAAIDDATASDEIVLSPHTFTGDGNRDLDFGGKAITMRSTNPLDPAVVAATIIDCQGTGTDPHRGFIFQSGETTESVVSGLTITNGHAADGVDGNETSPDGDHGSHGGGVYCDGSSPTITRCVLMANRAGSGGDGWSWLGDGGNGGNGGAIYCSSASPTITDCVLMANSAGSGGADMWEGYGGAGGSGGAIYFDGGSPSISDGTLTGNSAGDGGRAAVLAGSGGSGGAVYATATTSLVMASCDIAGNSAGNGGVTDDWQWVGGAGGGGGGIDSPGGLTLLGCRISGNTAGNGGECWYGDGGSGGSGGGISCGANATITECIITGNSAGNGFAGFADFYGGNGGAGGGLSCGENAAISASVIAGNAAGDGGGGDWMGPGGAGGDGGGAFCDGNAMIRNCLINGNTAGTGGDGGTDGGDGGSGGAISCPVVTIKSCTISGNASGPGGDGESPGADGSGGGVHAAGTIANSILWNNSGTYGHEIALVDTFNPCVLTVSYCDIQGGQEEAYSDAACTLNWEDGNMDAEPLFVGGPNGMWSADSTYDPDINQTTFADDTASWTAGVLIGKLVNPNTGQPLRFMIIANTADTITAYGDASAIAQAGDPYEVYDYHLRGDGSPDVVDSPCINTGDPAFDPEPEEKDVDGEDRIQHCRVDIGADETPYFRDCNSNGAGDACDISGGTSPDCNTNGIPDECEIDESSPAPGGPFYCDPLSPPVGLEECDPDCNENGIPDECEGIGPPVDPPLPEVLAVAKNRYISFIPTNDDRNTALRVTLVDMPAPLEDYEGCQFWLGDLRPVSESSGNSGASPQPAFLAAQLQSAPECLVWGLPEIPLYVSGEGIVPDGVYAIQAIDCECDFDVEENYSPPLSIATSVWGDVVGEYYTNPADCMIMPSGYVDCCGPPNGAANFDDISSIVDKFRNLGGAPQKSRADIAGDLPLGIPDQLVNFVDISYDVDAFRGLPYPFPGPPLADPCP